MFVLTFLIVCIICVLRCVVLGCCGCIEEAMHPTDTSKKLAEP
jgi:hypothetical protein